MIPDKKQQIIATHAAFICQVVEFAGNAQAKGQLEKLLSSAEQQGWTQLIKAVRQIIAGRRDLALLALDEEDGVIAEAILLGLQDPRTLPNPNQKPDPALAAPGLAHMIHAAGTGNAQALILIGNMAEQMSKAGGDMARLAGVIKPMIDGERDPDRLCKGMSSQGEQLVLNILTELGKLTPH